MGEVCLQHVISDFKDDDTSRNPETIGRDPEKWNRNLPHKVKSTSMTNVRAQDFKAMLRRSPALMPSVICRKTGITPRGSINVNNEVKHNIEYANISIG